METFELETPSVLIDLDVMQRNVSRMQAHCDSLGLKLRAHVSAHKIPDIARMQIDSGAQGIACQKVSEAQLFTEAGFNDVLIPYNIVGTQKTNKLADLALFNRVTVSVDHVRVLDMLAEAAKADEMSLRVLVELATDAGRTGAQVDEVVTLAERIEEDENLHFGGRAGLCSRRGSASSATGCDQSTERGGHWRRCGQRRRHAAGGPCFQYSRTDGTACRELCV
ncbi:MAG: alanine racemase [Anaerolineae bacterium]